MADLKTDYVDDVLDTDVNETRIFNIVDSDGNIVAENVHFVDNTTYTTTGDSYGATEINEQNEAINQLNADLTDCLPLSGGTMTGALTFANNTWNTVGDDVYIGDKNTAGALCMQGIGGDTAIKMYDKNGSNSGSLKFGTNNYFTFSNPIYAEIRKTSQVSSTSILTYINNTGSQFGCMGFAAPTDGPDTSSEWVVTWAGSQNRIHVKAVKYSQAGEVAYVRQIFNSAWIQSSWTQVSPRLIGTYSSSATVDVSAVGATSASQFVAVPDASTDYLQNTLTYVSGETGNVGAWYKYTAASLTLSGSTLTVTPASVYGAYCPPGASKTNPSTTYLATKIYFIG